MAESLLFKKIEGGVKILETVNNFEVQSGNTITPGTFVDFNRNVAALGSLQTVTSNTANAIVQDLTSNTFIYVYVNSNQSNRLEARIGTIDAAGTVTYGSVFATTITNATSKTIILKSSSTRVAIITIQHLGGGTANILGCIANINGDNITYSANAAMSASFTENVFSGAGLGTGLGVISHQVSGGGARLTPVIIGDTLTFQTSASTDFNSSNSVGYADVKQFENFFGQFTVTFNDNGNSSRGALSICSTSGSSVSVGTKSFFFGTASFFVAGISLSSTRVFVAFSHWNSTGQLYGIIGNVSGTTITSWGSTTEISSGENNNTTLQKINQNSIVILSRRVTSSESKVYLMTSTSGTSVGIAFNQTLTNTTVNFSSNVTKTKDNQAIVGLLGASSTGVISLLNLKDLVFNTSSITFKGLAKTGGTAGQTIEVFVNT